MLENDEILKFHERLQNSDELVEVKFAESMDVFINWIQDLKEESEESNSNSEN